MPCRKRAQGQERRAAKQHKPKIDPQLNTLNAAIKSSLIDTTALSTALLEAIECKSCIGCFGSEKLYYIDFHREGSCGHYVNRREIENNEYKIFHTRICANCLKGRGGNDAFASIINTIDFARKQRYTNVNLQTYKRCCTVTRCIDSFEDDITNNEGGELIFELRHLHDGSSRGSYHRRKGDCYS